MESSRERERERESDREGGRERERESCWAEIPQFALIGSSSLLHSTEMLGRDPAVCAHRVEQFTALDRDAGQRSRSLLS